MAEWKKVVVSGSGAILSQLNVGANQQITTAQATTFLTGSFTGSFAGNFVGTTNLPDLTQGTGITAFTYDGGATATVSVAGASTLTDNKIPKWTGTAFANSSLADDGTTITGATSLQLTGASSNLSGSFSGSFARNGASLTGVTATAIFPTTAKTDLANTDQFFINDGANKYVTYGNLLTDLAGTNLAVEGTDSLTLATTITGLTSVTSTTFVGNLTGTATTASNITPAITNNTDNRVLTATGGGTINGEGNLTFDGTTLTVTGNEVVTGNLTVQGTASFQQTTNLEVADRFVLFASGSNTAGDGGIVIQQGTQNVGELYGFENAANRWGFTSSFDASNSSFTPAAYITTTEFAASNPSAAPLYGGASNGYGNIHVNSSTGDIFIYS